MNPSDSNIADMCISSSETIETTVSIFRLVMSFNIFLSVTTLAILTVRERNSLALLVINLEFTSIFEVLFNSVNSLLNEWSMKLNNLSIELSQFQNESILNIPCLVIPSIYFIILEEFSYLYPNLSFNFIPN